MNNPWSGNGRYLSRRGGRHRVERHHEVPYVRDRVMSILSVQEYQRYGRQLILDGIGLPGEPEYHRLHR